MADLLIVMGTSLGVQPFASLTDEVPASCPRLLINDKKVPFFSLSSNGLRVPPLKVGVRAAAERRMGMPGLDFDGEENVRDVFLEVPLPTSQLN